LGLAGHRVLIFFNEMRRVVTTAVLWLHVSQKGTNYETV